MEQQILVPSSLLQQLKRAGWVLQPWEHCNKTWILLHKQGIRNLLYTRVCNFLQDDKPCCFPYDKERGESLRTTPSVMNKHLQKYHNNVKKRNSNQVKEKTIKSPVSEDARIIQSIIYNI